MESGILEGENFSSFLRTVSQRRRQGMLEIKFTEGKPYRILFVQGKIVELLHGDTPPALEVLQLLKEADLVPSISGVPYASYRALLEYFQNTAGFGSISYDLLKRVIKHRILNYLYQLDFRCGAEYTFNVQMVDYDKDFAPIITPGQLLLDIVALNTEGERFNVEFGADAEIKLSDPGSLNQDLTEEEWIVGSLAKEEISLDELARRSFLSIFHLQEALLSMSDRGLLTVRHTDRERTAGAALGGAEAQEAAAGQGEGEEAGDYAAGETGFEAGLRLKLRIWSALLLRRSWVPAVVAFVFVIAVVAIPFFLWRGAVLGFAK